MVDIIKLVKETSPNGVLSKIKNLKLENDIIRLTSFLDDEYPNVRYSQRFWHIRNEKFSIVRCGINNCNNPATYSKGSSAYRVCSTKCKNHVIEQTNLKKYGSKNQFERESVQKRIKDISIEKYGVDNIFKSKEFQEEQKKKSLIKYGAKSYMQTEEFKERVKKINIEKYGVDNIFKSKEFQERNKNNNKIVFEEIHPDYEYHGPEKKNRNYGVTHKICGNRFSIPLMTFYERKRDGGRICPKCYNKDKISNLESDLHAFLITMYDGEILRNKRKTIGMELDFHFPSMNLAIEFNGLYYHSSYFKDKDYHIDKSSLCSKNGIKLLHIWEDHWKFKQEIVKSILKSRFGKLEKVYARKCSIIEIDSKEERKFLNSNHIQGYSSSSVCYGLVLDGNLVQLMSFIRSRDIWKLEKLSSKIGLAVIGGADKLFKHFLKVHNPLNVLTFSMNDLFDGGVYEKLGFKFDGLTKPSYSYVKGIKRINRINVQKHKLVAEGYDKNKTEEEIMRDRGYYQLHNSGNKRWIWARPS